MTNEYGCFTNVYCDQEAETIMRASLQGSKILLFGLNQQLASGLTRALTGTESPPVDSALRDTEDCSSVLRRTPVDLIFCSSNPQQVETLLRLVRQTQPGVPVVVVSEGPEFGEWLDAMEAGASDFCASPFNQRELNGILASHLGSRAAAA